MGDEEVIHQLLTEMITSHQTPEEACADRPDLLPEVRRRWQRVRGTLEQLDALFPFSDPGSGTKAEAPDLGNLPDIPGYRVERVLGYGGMGVVYKAQHLALNRPVALKMVLAGAYASAPERQRLLREAQAVAALRHPNIVTVFDIGEYDRKPFFTMELVEGNNLAQQLAGTPQPARDAAATVATLAEAVHSAHQAGIIHRDLKPANVLLTLVGTPKITDFGLARHFEGEVPLTFTGFQVGTPSYMAPEQARGRADALGPSVDIYSLGALLYEMLTGRPPFCGETALETQRQVIDEEPAAPSRLNPKVPRDLETICLKCLEKDPKRRYATALELSEDLQRFERGEPITACRIGRLGRASKWCRRRPTQALFIAAIALTIAATLCAAIWWSGRHAAGTLAIERDLAELAERERALDWAGARTALERAKARDFGSAGAHERTRGAQEELDLVQQLDHIRLLRVTNVGTRFDRRTNNAEADRAYAAKFSAARLGDPTMPPARIAEQIRSSAVAPALLAALDDWAVSTTDNARRTWILEVARRADANPDAWRNQARAPAVWNDQQILKDLAKSAQVSSESVQLLTAFAERLQNSGADAVPFLQSVQAAKPADFWANTALGNALMQIRRFGEAVRFYQSALALRPNDAVPYDNLAVALAQDNRIDEAMDNVRAAIRIDPDYAHAHSSLGNCLKLKNRFAEALAEQLQAVHLEPGSSANRTNLAVALQDVGRVDEAIAQCRMAIRINPNDTSAHTNLAFSLAHAGMLEDAANVYRQVIQLAPDQAAGYSALGRTLVKLDHPEAALEPFTTAARLQPDSAVYRADRGVALVQLGRLDEALDMYRQTLALDPNVTESNEYLRTVLIEAGRIESVYQLWRKTLAADPPKLDARDGYAALCLFLNRLDDYSRECTILISRFGPNANASAAERVAQSSLLAPPPAADLDALAGIVNRTRPEAVFIRGLLAYRQGQFDFAEPLLQKAAISEPVGEVGKAPSIILALIAHRRGNHRLARQLLAEAIPAVDWRPLSASGPAGWRWHVLRREAEAVILPNRAAFLAGTYEPQDNDERLALIGVCESQNLHHLTARLYSDAFDADPALAENRQNSYRYNAACYALWAASEGDKDAVRLDDQDRMMWRAQSRQWLREELASWKRAAEDSPHGREAARRQLANWQQDADLAGLRDPASLARLSEAERTECSVLWSEVASTLNALQRSPPE